MGEWNWNPTINRDKYFNIVFWEWRCVENTAQKSPTSRREAKSVLNSVWNPGLRTRWDCWVMCWNVVIKLLLLPEVLMIARKLFRQVVAHNRFRKNFGTLFEWNYLKTVAVSDAPSRATRRNGTQHCLKCRWAINMFFSWHKNYWGLPLRLSEVIF